MLIQTLIPLGLQAVDEVSVDFGGASPTARPL